MLIVTSSKREVTQEHPVQSIHEESHVLSLPAPFPGIPTYLRSARAVSRPRAHRAAMTGRLCGRHSNPGVEAQREPELASRVLRGARARSVAWEMMRIFVSLQQGSVPRSLG